MPRNAPARKKNNAKPAAPAAGAQQPGAPPSPAHRGRLQVQGMDMSPEVSWPWAQATAPTATVAAGELDKLEERCTPTQQRNRDEAFPKARRFIMSHAGKGADAPVSMTFQNRGLPKTAHDARVDLEVRTGRAFT